MSSTDDIPVEVERNGDATILRPVGEVDLSTSSSLRVHINEAHRMRPVRLIIDLERVPYMDSSGVATLVEAMQVARRDGVELILCSLQERVRSVFEIARLDTVFTIVDTTRQALDQGA